MATIRNLNKGKISKKTGKPLKPNWCIVWREPWQQNEEGKRFRPQKSESGFKTKEAANRRKAELELELKDGTYMAMDKITFSEFVDKIWLPNHIEPRLKRSTYLRYK
jgi:hypothetical protein